MYIANRETEFAESGIIEFMPRGIRRKMSGINLRGVSEIRLRRGKPLTLRCGDGCRYVSARGNLTALPQSGLRVTREHIGEAMEIATASSVYSVKDEIKNGFITIRGGHRIGIAGTAVIKEDKVSFIKDISSMCYRIAGAAEGAADSVMPLILDGGRIKNTLIVSPPGAGKTTMLRDIARQLSYKAYSVSIVDERREIAAMYDGSAGFDLGFSADVLEGADKAEGMLMMLRSMSPDVIITDEIGADADIGAVLKAVNSGTAVIASIHGRDAAMIKRREDLRPLAELFDLIITLSRRNGAGTVEEAAAKW